MSLRPNNRLNTDDDGGDGDPTSDFEDGSAAKRPLSSSSSAVNQDASAVKAKAPGAGVDADDSKIDHRKKRRNRTTQSCLSCHQNKRKCDRGRPCGRCITLGLTGFCVYEVADKNRGPDADQVTQLRSRVAELEGVVRELKNKPQPRWAANATPAPSIGPAPTMFTPSAENSSSQQQPFAPPRDSFHIRSARKDKARSYDLGGPGENGESAPRKKRKFSANIIASAPGGGYITAVTDEERQRMDAYAQHALSQGMDLASVSAGSSSAGALGSPLFQTSFGFDLSGSSEHPLSPISPSTTTTNMRPDETRPPSRAFGLGLSSNNMQASSPYPTFDAANSAAVRRSLTGPPPSISSISRRVVAPSTGMPSPPTSSSSQFGRPAPPRKFTEPSQPCPCMADPTATQFVAHLTKNVRSTVEFLESKHLHEGCEHGTNGHVLGNKAPHDCGLMRALGVLDRAIKLSSTSKVRSVHPVPSPGPGPSHPLTPPRIQRAPQHHYEHSHLMNEHSHFMHSSPHLAQQHSYADHLHQQMMAPQSAASSPSSHELSDLETEMDSQIRYLEMGAELTRSRSPVDFLSVAALNALNEPAHSAQQFQQHQQQDWTRRASVSSAHSGFYEQSQEEDHAAQYYEQQHQEVVSADVGGGYEASYGALFGRDEGSLSGFA